MDNKEIAKRVRDAADNIEKSDTFTIGTGFTVIYTDGLKLEVRTTAIPALGSD